MANGEFGWHFRPDIEGLRAVAVLAVVLFHAGLPGIGGGFIGVDVFFVVSGFLITGLLWREAAETGTIRLVRFYGARARRLLPAAATVLVATVIGAVLLLPPLQARSVIGDGLAGALYAGNYRFAMQGTEYLRADAAPSPLQHYWSLGVEEQFYLLWPALILGIAWILGRTTKRAGVEAMRSAAPYALVLAALAGLSFLLSLAWTGGWPSWAFFSLPTRAWELAAGGLVALSVGLWRRIPAPAAAAVGWGGLALIVFACIQIRESTPYPGTAALLPVLGTAMVIVAGCAAPRLGVGRFLSWPLMRSTGRLSYSWYLWHWPVLVLAPALLGQQLSLAGRLAMVLVSLGLAILTLHLIEDPARFAAALRASGVRSLATGAVVTAVAVCASLVLLAMRPVPVGAGEALVPAANAVRDATSAGSAPVSSPRDQVRAAVAASAHLRAVPSDLTPSLGAAHGAKPETFVNGCVRSWLETDHPECVSGDPEGETTVVLFGDSHAAMWEPALNSIAQQRHWRQVTIGKATCPPQDMPIRSPYLGRTFTECEQWRAAIYDQFRKAPPDLVVIDMSRRYGADFGFTSYDEQWLDGLKRLVNGVRSTGARALVLGPVPDPHSTVPTCLSAHMDDAQACAPDRSDALDTAGIAAEKVATAEGGGLYADLDDLFCTAERCPVIVGDTLVFRDDNHITVEYARQLGPALGELVEQALAGN